jgi:hypothetical protein
MAMRVVSSLLVGVATFALAVPAAAQNGPVILFDGGAAPTVVHDDSHALPLAKAADLLARDLTALTGKAPVVTARTAGKGGPVVIIGLASAPAIARLLKANHIDPSPIAGKWETYGRAAVKLPGSAAPNALVIFGSDVRGTIWGVTDLSREMGVSPWEWWGDVAIRHRDRIAVDGALRFSKTPSIKYRGIFLNDEEFGIWPWAANTYDPKLHDLGPKTYARVYELMWRLKANIFWPGMRGIEKSFNQVQGNAELASAYGLVRASSHAEPMTRTNIREWDEKDGPFNYFTNREKVLGYWDEAVRKSAPFETMYTVGMRGIEDRPIQGADTPQAQARALEKIFVDQQAILRRHIHKPIDQIPQVFTPYKEVLPAYDSGLKVPDNVTITWPDDNYGYLRRLTNPAERQRPGGTGIYYHLSYWGYPMSYLWLANMHPGLMWEELEKAYHFDARQMWIVNVGDIKPGEYLSQLFLDIAFDQAAYPDIASVKAHLRGWAVENFGPEPADRIADILWRQYDLAFDRNPEFMGFTKTKPATPIRQTDFSITDFGDENARRLTAYAALKDEAAALAADMPADRRDAYYEMVQFPIDMAAAMNARQLNLDKTIAYAMQRRASANDYARRVDEAQAAIDAGGARYNNEIAGGKWRDMMGMQPHGLAVYQRPFTPTWNSAGNTGCGMQTEGGALFDGRGSTPGQPEAWFDKMPHLIRVGAPELSPFHAELGGDRYVDLFLQSPATVRWTATSDSPWIKVDQAAGTLTPQQLEQRVMLSIDWARAPAGGRGVINFKCENDPRGFPVTVTIAPPAPAGASFIEADRIVSMYATHADTIGAGWAVLPGLGHTGASLRADLDMASIDPKNEAAIRRAPVATWRFATTTTDDPATLRVIALPFQPVTSENGMRIAVSIDGGPLKVLDFAAPEFSQRWQANVQANTAVETVSELKLAAGVHQVTVYALDPGVTLDRLELRFTGAAPAYGAVPETRVAAPRAALAIGAGS